MAKKNESKSRKINRLEKDLRLLRIKIRQLEEELEDAYQIVDQKTSSVKRCTYCRRNTLIDNKHCLNCYEEPPDDEHLCTGQQP